MKAFEQLQPVVQLLYFIIILALAMFVMHPVVQVMLFLGGIVCFAMLKTLEDALKLMLGMLPVFLFIAIINPLFSHQGVTILGYFKSGNPLTLESILYGIHMAFMLMTTILWFYCMSVVMTSDKLIAISGKYLPTLSLMFTMLLRFIPHFRVQAKKTEQSMNGMGLLGKTNDKNKMKQASKVFLTMTTWALENSVDTADSMQARGFGLKKRSHFNRYSWRMLDVAVGIILILLGGYLGWILLSHRMVFYIYPVYYMKPFDGFMMIGIVILAFFLLMPLWLEAGDRIKWYNLKRKM